MIFKDWRAILNGTKTSDLRLMKSGEGWASDKYDRDIRTLVINSKGRFVYRVGQTYAVQPVANHPALIYHPNHPCYGIDIVEPDDNYYRHLDTSGWIPSGQGYITARIRITSIEKVMLDAFHAWRLTFELVKE